MSITAHFETRAHQITLDYSVIQSSPVVRSSVLGDESRPYMGADRTSEPDMSECTGAGGCMGMREYCASFICELYFLQNFKTPTDSTRK